MNSSFVSEVNDVADPDFLDISEISTSCSTSKVLQLLHQLERKDLVRDFTLSEISAVLLTSRLNENHLIYPGISITYYLEREMEQS